MTEKYVDVRLRMPGVTSHLWFLIAFAISLCVYGTIPFISLHSILQTLGTTIGFAQSLANADGLSLYAHNFGYPTPMPRTFGLSGVLPAQFFLFAGLSPADAYSSMVTVFLALAFWGAYRFVRHFGAQEKLGSALALLWMLQPIVWNHAGYSMLSLGIALLPFYFFVLIRILADPPRGLLEASGKFVVLFLTTVLAVFMDGYSFMMFASGASLLYGVIFLNRTVSRSALLLVVAPGMAFAFGGAYILYRFYVGGADFPSSPIEFFRGWGLDVSFVLIPTRGVSWLWDVLGLSIARSNKEFFGDASVWSTTFSIPIIIAGLGSWWWLKKSDGVPVIALLVVALFGSYMALGPSFKFFSTKQAAAAEAAGALMPEQASIAPTGTAFISQRVPGFKSMRATYRWQSLAIFGFWALTALMMIRLASRSRIAVCSALGLLMLSVVPDIKHGVFSGMKVREAAFAVDHDLLTPLAKDLTKGEKVAFLPYRNDLMVNYLAARLDVTAFNVGGDKNLAMARKGWPATMREFRMGTIDEGFSSRVLLLLAKGYVDKVIFPYVDSVRGFNDWPSPAEYQDDLAPIEVALSRSNFVNIDKREFYSLVTLKPEFAVLAADGQLESRIRAEMCLPPFCLERLRLGYGALTQVGLIQDNSIVGDGKRGFLHFGPYVALHAGRYELVVQGAGRFGPNAWVDVVSAKGTVKHGKFPLQQLATRDGKLVEGVVQLDSDVNDVEVRVHVGDADEVILRGFSLKPAAR